MYSDKDLSDVRKMIMFLAFEQPLVILIKLADRLHNMRRQGGSLGGEKGGRVQYIFERSLILFRGYHAPTPFDDICQRSQTFAHDCFPTVSTCCDLRSKNQSLRRQSRYGAL